MFDRNKRTSSTSSMVRAGIATLAALCALSVSGSAWAQGAQGHTFGLGIILGEPSGLTLKQWFNPSNALDVHLAFDFTDDALAVFSDYLFHFDAFRISSGAGVDLPLYVGIGGKLLVDANDNNKNNDKDTAVALGARVPIGLAVLLKKAPLEIFVEIAPGVLIIPRTTADIDGGVGVRYYF